MRRMLALELREAFSNRWFTIAVLAAVLLAALAAGESVEKFNTNGFDASDSSYYAYYSSWSSVSVWLGVGTVEPVLSLLLRHHLCSALGI